MDAKIPMHNPDISSFVNFLRTGELGPIRLGLKAEEIYPILGKPLDSFRPFEASDHDHLLNLHYKNLMLTFYGGDLGIFIIQFQDGYKPIKGGLPPQLKIKWFSGVKKMTFEEI